MDSEYESVRELAVQSKKQGLALSDLASHFRLQNFIKKLGANEDQIESFVSKCTGAAGSSLPPEKVIDLVNQLFDITKSDSIPFEQIPAYIRQKLQQKQKIDEQIKEAEAVLQNKNVSIEDIDEHIHLKKELGKHGLSAKDTRNLVNVIKNIEQQGFDTKKIVAKAISIKSLKHTEKALNSCEILADKISEHKEILPLVERIAAMKMSVGELMALNAAVTETADLYNLPVSAAAFQVIHDLRDYNKTGGLKKQLETLCAQVYAVKEVCSHQYQAMVAFLKLQSCGITEDRILLYLNNLIFERNMMNNKINPESA